MVTAALALGACGSSTTTHSIADPAASSVSPILAGELSYYPQGSPLIVSIPTGALVNDVQSAEKQTPSASAGLELLGSKLSELGLTYSGDIKPLIGNPILFGAAATTLGKQNKSSFLAVWQTNSASALSRLLSKVPGLTSSSSYDGAKLYALGTTVEAAISGGTLIASSSLSLVQAALDRHAHSTGFPASEFSRLTAGLPTGKVDIVGDLNSELSLPAAAKARKVPWVAALHGYGVAVTGTQQQSTLNFRLDTSGAPLTAAELPLASGSGTPELAGSMPITAGFENVAHTYQFFEQAAQLSGASGFAKFLARQQTSTSKTGYDLNDLLGLLTGAGIVGSDTTTTIGRVGVSDPSKAATILAALAKDPSEAIQGATAAKSIGNGLYSVTQKRGPAFTIGVIGSQLVIGEGTVAAIQAFAAAPATAAPGASGQSLALRIDLPQLIALKVHSSSTILTLVTHLLGNVTGSATNTASALSGSISLAIHAAGLGSLASSA